MDILKYIKKSLWVIPVLGLASCSDFDDYATSIENRADSFELTAAIPSYQLTTINSRSEGFVDKLTVVYYKNDTPSDISNSFIKSEEINSYSVDGNKVSMTIPKVADAKYIHILINGDLGNSKDASSVFVTDASENIYWGKAQIPTSGSKIENISLIHHNAKISVLKDNKVSNFTISGYGVHNVRQNGALGAKGWNISPSEPNLHTTAQFVTLDERDIQSAVSATPEIYVFETEAGKTKIIIKGRYNGASNDSYYTLGLTQREARTNNKYPEVVGDYTYTDLPVIRGHHYQLTIDEVRAEGWPDLDAAIEAKPDNRMTAWITDINESIVDIIACRDYALGVNEPKEIPATGADLTTTISIMTSYEGNIEVSSPSGNWATKGTLSDKQEISNSSPKAYLYTIPITGTANKNQEKRTATVTVTAGDLKRTVTITQNAFNVYSDPDREVDFISEYIHGDDYAYPYYTWLSSCYGVTPEANRGEVRNEGLHFPPVNSYSIEYIIPKKVGDNNPKLLKSDGSSVYSSTGFSLDNTKSDGYHITASANEVIEKAIFQFEDSEGHILQYDLYKTGIFHKLTSGILSNAYNPAETSENKAYHVKEGWYYYELVKVGDVMILDRNIGASTNAAYKSTSSDLRKNTGAIGAFLKIATEKEPNDPYDKDDIDPGRTSAISTKTIESALDLPEGFKIPVQSQIEGLSIAATDQSAGGGTAIVATVGNVEGEVAGKTIFFPHGGYYDSVTSTFLNDESANVWTKSLHCYSQGFDSKRSPEFGYWYRCLNGYGSTVGASQIDNISQVRFVDGSEGSNTGVYRYMPIRLVFGGPEADTPPPPPAKKIIYWDNSEKNWSSVKAYWYIKGDDGNTWPGDVMTKVSGTANMYQIEVPDNMTNIVFVDGNNDGNKCPSQNGYDPIDGYVYGPNGKRIPFTNYVYATSTATSWYLIGTACDGADYGAEFLFYNTNIPDVYKTSRYVKLWNGNSQSIKISNKSENSYFGRSDWSVVNSGDNLYSDKTGYGQYTGATVETVVTFKVGKAESWGSPCTIWYENKYNKNDF